MAAVEMATLLAKMARARTPLERKDLRHRAREAALQILYQWEIGQTDVPRATETFFSLQWPDETPPPEELRSQAADPRGDRSGAVADRRAHRRDHRAVAPRADGRHRSADHAAGHLRAAAPGSTPPPVIINEALELARTFSTEESVKFINGMLDAIRRWKLNRRPRDYVIAGRTDRPTPRRTSSSSRSWGSTSTPAASIGATPSPSWSPRTGRRATTSWRPNGPKRSRAAGSWRSGRLAKRTSWPSPTDRQDPDLYPAGLAAAARLPDLQAARFRRLDWRRGPACSAPRPTSSPSGRRGCTSSPSASCRCPRSGTGSPTWRSATGSATSTSSSIPSRAGCSRCAAASSGDPRAS